MITLKELAARCNVSIATVSNILNGKSNVSEATKNRVLEVIKETGYKPNYMARGLRANKSKTVGVIVDELNAFSTPSIIEGIMSQFDKNGYRTIIENLCLYRNYDENISNPEIFIPKVLDAIQQMLAIKVDGIIYIAAFDRNIDFIPDNLEVPVVVGYSVTKNPDYYYVAIDDYTSAYEMTDFLVNKGFSKIAVISGNKGNSHGDNRLKGFKDALVDNNLQFSPDLVQVGYWNRKGGYNACKNLPANAFDKGNAIFCFNDEMAAGVYDFLLEKNLVPGKDIAVAGFDNQNFSEYMNPPLTTMEIPLEEIGKKTGEVILKKINGTEVNKKNCSVPCRLINRKSV